MELENNHRGDIRQKIKGIFEVPEKKKKKKKGNFITWIHGVILVTAAEYQLKGMLHNYSHHFFV